MLLSRTLSEMFQAVVSLLLFGTLSPLSLTAATEAASLAIAPPGPLENVHIAGRFSASGVIVMDMLSGKEMFSYEADTPRPMGSLAKLMTFDVIVKNHELNEIVTIPRSVVNVEGSIAGLQPGERYVVRDLLSMLLIASANDAAYTLALYHSGDIPSFAQAMNDRALALGLTSTSFENPIGFDGIGQQSTPRELAWLSMYVWKHPLARSLAGRRLATVYDTSGDRTIVLRNTNRLLFSHPAEFSGLKTGTTTGAGECLISMATIQDRPYLFVVLHSSDRYEDTLTLFDSLSQSRT